MCCDTGGGNRPGHREVLGAPAARGAVGDMGGCGRGSRAGVLYSAEASLLHNIELQSREERSTGVQMPTDTYSNNCVASGKSLDGSEPAPFS